MQLTMTDTRYSNNFYYYQEDTIIGRSLLEYGEYQQGEIDFLQNASKIIDASKKRPSVAWDIGANIGYHTTGLASWCKEVHSFEAHPDNYKLLKLNVENTPGIFTYNTAIGNGTEPLTITPLDQLTEENNFGFARIAETGISIPQIRLDDVPGLTPPTIMKIDVEGYEIHVLKGAEKTIKTHMPVMSIEAMENTEEIIRWFEGTSYHLYWGAIRNFRANNFKKNPGTFFVNENSAIFTIIASPVPVTDFEKITGPTDHWKRFS